jgi:alkanesulfonate monooxygenase SsuD/methylene tetrahydromethanopterin reductase-like flavin-dependent oxidoreductase (luciferase family)
VFTPTEREIVRGWTAPLIRGEPEHVRTELEGLARRTGADELMITTMIHGPADRLRSYELVAETWNRASLAPGIPEPTV